MVARRTLKFATLDEVVRDAENLLANGYDRAGTWSLAQCCGHLVYWLTAPLDGFGNAPLPIAVFLWFARNTFGPKKLKQYIADRSFPAGAPTDPKSVPTADSDDRGAVEQLKLAAMRLKNHTGVILPSPMFGPMDKETAVKLQLVHCAHHLSFLVPKTS
jgi:Protein of unknown function (DUF1569)